MTVIAPPRRRRVSAPEDVAAVQALIAGARRRRRQCYGLAVLIGLAMLVAGCAGDAKPSSAGGNGRADRPDLQRLLAQVREAGAPGAVALVRNRSGTWRTATGSAVLKPRQPMRAGDRIRIASITKTFVATVVLQLVGEGRLALDDTVERWLPGVLRFGRKLTVRQLLNHTSGFASGDENFPESERLYAKFLSDIRFDVSVRNRIALADSRLLHFEPGTRWRYTNSGYDVLGLIVERVAGEPLADVLAERIFEPLKLRRTSFERKLLHPSDIAHGYAIPGSDLPEANWAGPQDVTGASLLGTWASAAVVSNVDDLATFCTALLGGRLLPSRLLAEMQETVPTDSRELRAGFGIFRDRERCGYSWGHGGATLGYTARVVASKDGSHIVVVGANAFSPGAFVDAVLTAARRMYCNS